MPHNSNASPRSQLTSWLVEKALPMWSQHGVDHAAGGFFEQIDLSGKAVEMPRRTRVVARQIYVFAAAARHGWLPGADALVDHGLHFLLHRMRLPEGYFAASVETDGRVVNGRFDLYEQAFALFALASASQGRADRSGLRTEAEALLACVRSGWAHSQIGFEEAAPRELPLKSNPHMHLLEAALAWAEISSGPQRTVWAELADELVQLCLSRFINAESGALHEYFDGDWQPMPGAQGELTEPGHQFEWAWLLTRWSGSTGADASRRAQAIAAAQRLRTLAETHGIDRARGVAVNALGAGFQITDNAAKLWPQTEWIKAWNVAVETAQDAPQAELARQHLQQAVDGLAAYFLAEPAGLWNELMRPDSSFEAQDCKASSLYHIVCAIEDLQR